MYYISYNPYIVDSVFEGTLSDCMTFADKNIVYNQCDITIYADNSHFYPVAYRRWYGCAPDDEALDRDIVSFGTFGYYDEWFNYDDIRDICAVDYLC